jgi:hypothetical protein
LGNFNERNFLIRALVGVFLIQFITVFYQIYSCQTAIKSGRESDKVALICSNASSSFNETGKLALATFLALLVPSSSQTVGSSVRSKRKTKSEGEDGTEDTKVG